MSRPALPEECGADLRSEPPTLNELRRAHDWRTEERAEGQFVVDVCEQCGYERAARRAGRPPDCEVRDVPDHLVSLAKRHDLLPETTGAREDSMTSPSPSRTRHSKSTTSVSAKREQVESLEANPENDSTDPGSYQDYRRMNNARV